MTYVRGSRACCDAAEHKGTLWSDRGSIAIVMLAVVVVGCMFALGAARLGRAATTQATVDAAADAAALAAADALAMGRGGDAARAAAADIASANGTRLLSCHCDGVHAEVEVEFRRSVEGRRVRGRARAEVLLLPSER